MKLNGNSYLWISVAAAMSSPAVAQTPNPMVMAPNEAHEAAMKSLLTFQELAPNLSGNGPGEKLTGGTTGSKPSLGNAIPDYAIDIDALKKWDGRNPAKLLRSTGQFVYPIAANGTAQSAVTMAKMEGDWTAVTFASPEEAQARSRASKEGEAPGGNPTTIQVRVPTLHATFIARQIDGKLVFTPIDTQAPLGLHAGKSEPATKVLLRLKPAAKRINLDNPG